ncbi:hypothetical protein J416_09379 [Gracilibacillus halophilus YIM-C55.5]|uniref:Uncharacterized protein n=1 Tax=Gracilibacillus halophilus YIM-C55.5 TaxID=1308866 RepID=N4W8S3_9BACI|nr:hypothetical protein [Gracilibacillus halophilus]ENH96698.1 hypothetical protein J416_09379 [Gracilibacillus halophilus YIM-C55.5]
MAQKVIIQTETRLRFDEKITVVQPNNMDDDTFEALLEKAETKAFHFDGDVRDLASILKDYGIETDELATSFPESPSTADFEIVDVRDKK